jgi:uncharacterized iron-regulated protein
MRITQKYQLPLLRVALVLVAMVILVFAFPLQAAHENLVFRAGSLRRLSLEALVKEIGSSRVITIGEQHGNNTHHQVQLLIINAIHGTGQDIAIGFEQFGARSQKGLNSWTAGKSGIDDLFQIYSRDWEANWWYLYLPVFRYARAHEIPMVGLNIPREIVRQVADRGFSSLNSKQRGQIKVLSCSIDEKYQEALRRVLGQKRMESEGEVFNRFCEAQVVWDTSMAINAVEYLKANPEKTLVILAGNFHAWKRGIPEQVGRISDVQVSSILPSEDPSFFNYDAFIEDSDYVWQIE